jgi:hypothetical protein
MYIADRRKLLLAIEAKGLVLPKGLERTDYYDYLYDLPYGFTHDPNAVFSAKVFPDYGTKKQIGFIVRAIATSYPKASQKLSSSGTDKPVYLNVSDLISFTESLLSLIELKSGPEPIPNFLITSLERSPKLWAQNLIEHIARHEAFMEIDDFTNELTADIGRPSDDTSVKSVESLVYEKRRKNGKIKQKEIAEELNLSAARVSQIFKELGFT